MDGIGWFVVVGLGAGLVANIIKKECLPYLIINFLAGIIGALIGVLVYRFVDANPGEQSGLLLAAAMGAVLLILDTYLVQNMATGRLWILTVLDSGTSCNLSFLAMEQEGQDTPNGRMSLDRPQPSMPSR
jgi:uncharacterized membrane protein YeaQ/YmgE (transglycosylase-associated protein family)